MKNRHDTTITAGTASENLIAAVNSTEDEKLTQSHEPEAVDGTAVETYSAKKVLTKTEKKKFVYRVLIYILGLFIIGMGVAFAINSNLGISAASSLPYVLYLVTDIPLTVTITALYTLWVGVQWIVLRKNFRWYNIFQVVFALIFGYFCDLCKSLLGGFCFPTYFGQLGMIAISVILIALGVILYVDVKLLPLPVEGMALAFASVTKIKFPYWKIIIDATEVALGIILSFIAFGKLVGIREGTIILALTVGLVIKVLQKFIKPVVDKICF